MIVRTSVMYVKAVAHIFGSSCRMRKLTEFRDLKIVLI